MNPSREDVLLRRRQRWERLDEALEDLRQEGQAWPPPPAVPLPLLRACRQRRALRTWRRGAWWAVAAAAASLAVLAWVGPPSGAQRRSHRLSAAPAAPAAAGPLLAAALPVASGMGAQVEATAAFLPLAGTMPANGFVVRVNLPAADLASLGIAAPPEDGTVPAEVLMSNDGVPCGIRFLSAASAASDAAAGTPLSVSRGR